MIMKLLAILILAALPLLTGCYTTPGYYGGNYGYMSGSPYYYGGSYGYGSGSSYYYGRKHGYVYRPPYLGFGYPYAYKHHHRHSGVRSHKHPIRKGHSPHHRFHRPTISRDITSIEPPGNTAAAKNTGSSNDRLVVIITAVQGRVSGAVIKGPSRVSRVVIAVQGRVSGVVIKVPGRVSGGIVAAPAAVSVGEPHSAAASADEVLASAMCFWS
jgi:hypothetical protein